MATVSQPIEAGVYVYCIMRIAPLKSGAMHFNATAIGGRNDTLRTIHYREVAAVVSDSPSIRYNISRENMMTHQLVLEEVMSSHDILPVRFSTVAESDQQVREKLLMRRYDELYGLIDYIQGKIELGLKVFWNRERFFTEMVAENEEIRDLRDFIVDKPPEAAYHERIKLGQLTEEAINRKREQEAAAISETFHPLAVEEKVNKTLMDTMVINAAYLIEKKREPEFDAAVDRLDDEQAERLTLKYHGPVPPYNFVNIVLPWGD